MSSGGHGVVPVYSEVLSQVLQLQAAGGVQVDGSATWSV